MPTEDDLCTNEKQLENLILDWIATQENCYAIKINNVGVYDSRKRCYRKSNSVHQPKGVPDIIGMREGRFFGVEVKYGKGKPSEFQTRFIERVKEAGGVCFWCNSFADFMEKWEESFPDSYPVIS